jgi:hypothetical protein
MYASAVCQPSLALGIGENVSLLQQMYASAVCQPSLALGIGEYVSLL